MKNITKQHLGLVLALIIFVFAACNNKNVDSTRPTITTDGIEPCPVGCQAFAKGSTIEFCYRFTDDVELGNYNIEVHSNFDHHTHSTDAVECDEGEEHGHAEGEPWVFNRSYSIPDGTKDYVARTTIDVPATAAEGHYHFMILVTDKVGWQEMHSVEIQVVD